MLSFIVRRILAGLLTIFVVVSLVFILLQLAPGDPAEVMLGQYATVELIKEFRATMGVDKPLIYQYWLYTKAMLSGDLGYSYSLNKYVGTLIGIQYPHTINLAVGSMIVAACIGIPLGMLAAIKRDSVYDRFILVFTVAWIAAPSFWIGLILLYVFGMVWQVFPLTGAGRFDNLPSILTHLWLPILTMGLRSSALITRMARSAVLDNLSEEYVNTARSKGLSAARVLLKHVFRNAGVQLVSIMSVELTILMGGAVVMEAVFSRPGIGSLLVDGVGSRDYPLVAGTILFFVLAVVAINLVTDLSICLLDPRVRVD